MSRMTLYLRAEGDELKLIGVKSNVYTGNINSYICEFELSSEWKDMNVFAVFCVDGVAYTTALMNDRSCILPNEVIENEGEFFVGLYATNSDSENLKRISTGLISAKIEKGCFADGLTPQAPTPEVWEQLILKTVPCIGENKNWFVYDMEAKEYKDTGVCSVSDVGKDLQRQIDLKADTYTINGGFNGGQGSATASGGAIGKNTNASNGGAIGDGARAMSGFAGGAGAVSTAIASIQLGSGTNSKERTLKVFEHIVMEADGSLPYVHEAVPHCETAVSGTLEVNKIYELDIQTTLDLVLPTAVTGNFIQIDFISAETPTNVSINSNSGLISNYDFVPEANKVYSLFFDYGILASTARGWRVSYAEYDFMGYVTELPDEDADLTLPDPELPGEVM